MRKLAVVLALVVAAVLAGPATASALTVYVRNTSTAMSDAQIRNALPALQAQVSVDFAPVWNTDATLDFIGSAPAPAGGWLMTVNDYSDVQGALGYHQVCTHGHDGTPCGYVSAQTTLTDGLSPTVTLSHELLEMLADPFTTTMQKVGTRFFIQEVCDAPEADGDGYTRPGADGSPIMLSDFVTPAWFRPGHVGPYDFRGLVKKPLQLLAGGYISYWQNGSWHQNFKRHAGRNIL